MFYSKVFHPEHHVLSNHYCFFHEYKKVGDHSHVNEFVAKNNKYWSEH